MCQYSGDETVIYTLKKYMNPKVYNSFYKNYSKLIYGHVQSGKTKSIINEIHKNTTYTEMTSILVIQNSLLILSQYIERFLENKINFQVVTGKTKQITSRVLIVMNNKHRINAYLSCENRPSKYVIILDESDQTCSNELVSNAVSQIHVTATPFINKYRNYFDEISYLDKSENYYGLDRVNIHPIKLMNNGDEPYKNVINDKNYKIFVVS
jgi:hypothetical protein